MNLVSADKITRCPRCLGWCPPISNCELCDDTRFVSQELSAAYTLIAGNNMLNKYIVRKLREELGE